MSPLASRSDETNARDAIPSLSMGLNVDPEWGVPLSATPTPTGTPALGQKDFDRRIKRKYVPVCFFSFLPLERIGWIKLETFSGMSCWQKP